MMQEVFDSSLQAAEVAVEEAKTAVGSAEAAKGELATKAAEAEAVLTAVTEDAEAKKAAKTSAVTTTAEMNTALKTKLDEQKKGDAAAVQLGKDKDAFEALMANEWKQLMDGTWEKPAQAKKLYTAVAALTKKLVLEESMLAALPSVCQKAASERGAFDTMCCRDVSRSSARRWLTLPR